MSIGAFVGCDVYDVGNFVTEFIFSFLNILNYNLIINFRQFGLTSFCKTTNIWRIGIILFCEEFSLLNCLKIIRNDGLLYDFVELYNIVLKIKDLD